MIIAQAMQCRTRHVKNVLQITQTRKEAENEKGIIIYSSYN